jgi:RNA recognition motif-containing protein
MRIFVGNVIFTATEEDLVQLFEPYGQVTRVLIATDRETGRARGFAFVEMPNASDAQAAIAALHGTSLAGRPLTVNQARDREARPQPRW